MLDVQPPPYEYVRPFDGPLYVLQLPMNRVGIVCRMIGLENIDGTREIRGCAQVKTSGACLVVVPKVEREITEQDRVAILQHEIAHCNGWRHEEN